jgi:hypothetical protein|nr:MAG TPA: Recombination enhancement, RecA-dependent nuclease [Caudoviricetes sp.]
MNTYYQNCPFPKPINKKRKKKVNGYKDKPDRVCFYCKTPYAERHEVFSGANRQISIDHGFQVDLCPRCHREIQDQTTERGRKRADNWKKAYQVVYENKLMEIKGLSAEEARAAWLALIGRSYL